MSVTALLREALREEPSSLQTQAVLIRAIRETIREHRESHLLLIAVTNKAIAASHVVLKNCGWYEEWHSVINRAAEEPGQRYGLETASALGPKSSR
jgi:hypothetical protein